MPSLIKHYQCGLLLNGWDLDHSLCLLGQHHYCMDWFYNGTHSYITLSRGCIPNKTHYVISLLIADFIIDIDMSCTGSAVAKLVAQVTISYPSPSMYLLLFCAHSWQWIYPGFFNAFSNCVSIVEIFFQKKNYACTIPTTIVLDSFLNMHYHVVTYSDCYLFLYVTIHSLWLATSMQFILLSGMMEIHPSDASRLSYKCMDRCCYVYYIAWSLHLMVPLVTHRVLIILQAWP